MAKSRHNVTIVLEEDLLLAARKIALEQKTSVNQLVRNYLINLVEEHKQQSIKRLKELMNSGVVEVGEITWTRDELYDRSL